MMAMMAMMAIEWWLRKMHRAEVMWKQGR